jgi:hypothetical protein
MGGISTSGQKQDDHDANAFPLIDFWRRVKSRRQKSIFSCAL